MRILFISRAYPPVLGGIENQNYALSAWLPKYTGTRTIANRSGKKGLPFFLPLVLLRGIFLLPRYEVLLLGDGVLAPLGAILKFLFPRKTVVSVIHGLDITYASPFYQRYWVRMFLPRLDGFIAVSNETRQIAIKHALSPEKIVVIPNGVEPEAFRIEATRADLESLLGESLSDKKVLLTTGRLVRRKGAEWFIRNVLVKLPANVLYVLAGEGPERGAIEKALTETGLEGRVRLLGRVSDKTRNLLLNTVDIFIQPNIPVPGDMEGFGIAVIEAAGCRRPVVASALEGLKDAIKHNENGVLVEAGDSAAFLEAIGKLLSDENQCSLLGERAYRYTETHYHWSVIARLYIEALEAFAKRVE